jgi:hypothetical protein
LPHTTKIVVISVVKNVTCGLRKRPLLTGGFVQWLSWLFVRCCFDLFAPYLTDSFSVKNCPNY